MVVGAEAHVRALMNVVAVCGALHTPTQLCFYALCLGAPFSIA